MGHRGSGKTSVLRKIDEMVRMAEPAALVTSVPLAAVSDAAGLIQAIVDDIVREVKAKAKASGRFGVALKNVQSLSLSVLGFGGTIERRQPPAVSNPIVVWKECLGELREFPFLCVCLDDADNLDKRGVGTLKAISETTSPIPLLLFVTAGLDIREKLESMDSAPVVRIFSGARHDMEEFTRDETSEALEAPLRNIPGSGSWSEGATDRIHQITHGFPYLVQCFGQAAYSDGVRIESQRVDDTVQTALNTGGDWLASQCPSGTDGDFKAFARIAGLGRFHLRHLEILAAGVNANSIRRLVKLGVLKFESRGHYAVAKAPAIAYYQVMTRHLV